MEGPDWGKDWRPRNPSDHVRLTVEMDPTAALSALELIRLKLVEIREEAERTAVALAKIAP